MNSLRPTSPEALLDAIAGALAHKVPLELIGGGTKRVIGRPVEAEATLDLSGLDGIGLYEPAELVLSARAGTKLVEIEAALAESGQRLGFEPPDYALLLGGEPGRQTLGGIVAANLAGSRRLSAGAARDHVLGFSAVSGRGEAFKSGGRVVKNVTGYDLSKLICGSWGTLAALAEITVKVLPRPDAETTLLLHGLDAPNAVAAMSRALGSPQEVSAAAWLPSSLAGGIGRGSTVTALRLEGLAGSVRFRAAALLQFFERVEESRIEEEESAALWRIIGNAEPLATASPAFLIWKISVPPSAGPAILAACGDGQGFLDWGGGLVWCATGLDEATALRQAVARHGGHATLIRAPAALRASSAVFEPLGTALGALTRRVKQGFDPEKLLNPGRLYAGL
jgi:glycolate oxidase FAD binding subunit